MAWRWSDRDLTIDGAGVMETALTAAMDATADHGGSREDGGQRFMAYLKAIARAGPDAAISAEPTSGVRVSYGDIPPAMRFYWGVDPACGRCLVFLNWAWCLPDVRSDSALHRSKVREAAALLDEADGH